MRYICAVLITLALTVPARAEQTVSSASTVSDWIVSVETVYRLPRTGREYAFQIHLRDQERTMVITDPHGYGEPRADQSVLFLRYTLPDGREVHEIFIGEGVYADQM
jgi:hypothetical protein